MKFRKMCKGVVSAAVLCCAVLLPLQTVNAESELLNSTKMLYQGQKIDVNLYGEKLDSGYAYDLLLVLKREDGSVVTGYKPTIKGGYDFKLIPAKIKAKDVETEQLVLTAMQGDWRAYSEFRVLDFDNARKVEELFNVADSFGVVTTAGLEGNTVKLKTVRDKELIDMEIDTNILNGVAENRRKVQFGKLYSLTVFDVDEDGKQELLTDQQLYVDKKIIADVGAVWRYIGPKPEAKAAKKPVPEVKAKSNSVADIMKAVEETMALLKSEDKAAEETKSKAMWRQDNMTIMKNNARDKRNTVNCGAFFQGGMIYPVKLIAPNGEATYPQFAMANDYQQKNAWNKLLDKESEEYIRSFVLGRADMAFNVLNADDKIISIQLISGKTSFEHHHVNLVPDRNVKLELSDLLNVKDKKLVELLNVLNKNPKINFDKALTDEWYITDDKLHLMKKVEGAEEYTTVDLADLQKYVKLESFKQEPKASAR